VILPRSLPRRSSTYCRKFTASLPRLCITILPRVYRGIAAKLPQICRVITATNVIISHFSSFQANYRYKQLL
jgi:hypothetical protein